MFLKQIIAEKRILKGKHASFKNIKFPRGNYQTDSSETYCSPLNFLPPASSESIELFLTFWDKRRENQM